MPAKRKRTFDTNDTNDGKSDVIHGDEAKLARFRRKLASRTEAKTLYHDVPNLITMIALACPRVNYCPSDELMKHLSKRHVNVVDDGQALVTFLKVHLAMIQESHQGWSNMCIQSGMYWLATCVDKTKARTLLKTSLVKSMSGTTMISIYEMLFRRKQTFLIVYLIDAFYDNNDIIDDMICVADPCRDIWLDHSILKLLADRPNAYNSYDYPYFDTFKRVEYRLIKHMPHHILCHDQFFPFLLKTRVDEAELVNKIIRMRHEDLRLDILFYHSIIDKECFQLISPTLLEIQTLRRSETKTITNMLYQEMILPILPLCNIIIDYKWTLFIHL